MKEEFDLKMKQKKSLEDCEEKFDASIEDSSSTKLAVIEEETKCEDLRSDLKRENECIDVSEKKRKIE